MKANTLLAAALVAAFSAHAQQLQPRDLDGDGTTDAYFDTAQAVTFLADANTFAASLFGVDGWRLPIVSTFACTDADGASVQPAASVWCAPTESELSRLSTFAPFENLQPIYWLGTDVPAGPFNGGNATFYSLTAGHGTTNERNGPAVRWAVHDGDVGGNVASIAVVPEPETWAMFALGILALLAHKLKAFGKRITPELTDSQLDELKLW